MTKTIDKIAFEYWAGIGSKDDLENWATDELRKEEPHPDACELFNLTNEHQENQALRLAEELTDFKPVSEQGEIWAKELLSNYCESLLKEDMPPFDFCKLVQLFDASFLGIRTLSNGSLEYPEWLGDLWNNCDWCDESWTISTSPHLAKEALKVLNNKT